MEITVQQLTDEIRKTLGTPFHHGGRVVGPNGGLDCGGVIVVSLKNLGFDIYDKPFYNRGDGLQDMIEVLEANNFSQREPGSQPQAGDLILIRTSTVYHHLVYLTEQSTIIHAWFTTGVNKVVETTMLPDWWDAIHSVWRFGSLV